MEFCRKNILPEIRSIKPGRKSLILLQPLDSNFTYNTHTLSELNKTNTCFDHGLPTLHIRVLNTLVPKFLEPNIINNVIYLTRISYIRAPGSFFCVEEIVIL